MQTVTNNRRGRASLTDQFWRSRSAPLALVCGGIVIALVVTALFAAVLYQGRLDAMERAGETSRNLALIAERDIERNLELYALSLQAVVDGVRDPEVMALQLLLTFIAHPARSPSAHRFFANTVPGQGLRSY